MSFSEFDNWEPVPVGSDNEENLTGRDRDDHTIDEIGEENVQSDQEENDTKEDTSSVNMKKLRYDLQVDDSKEEKDGAVDTTSESDESTSKIGLSKPFIFPQKAPISKNVGIEDDRSLLKEGLSISTSNIEPITDAETNTPDDEKNPALKSVTSPSFISDMFASFRSPRSSSSSSSTKNLDLENDPTTSNLSARSKVPTSPNIISHRREPSLHQKRKQNRNKRVSSVSSQLSATSANSPLQKVEKPREVISHLHKETQQFDARIYKEEKFLDTEYHYATEERDHEFHNLFEEVPLEDKLLDDFSCALSKEFIYQGRLYISESFLSFNSKMLGWVSREFIPFSDIVYMEKTNTAKLFPNAISIETKKGVTQFNGFVSRDATFNMIKEVWSRSLLSEEDGGHKCRELLVIEPKIDESESGEDKTDTNEAEIIKESNLEDEKEEDEEDENSDEFIDEKLGVLKRKNVFKFKSSLDYKYDGPKYFHETKFSYSPEDNNEYVLTEVELGAPPGVIFEIMFSETNHSFLFEYLQTQKSSQFSEIPAFDSNNSRKYSYEKALDFSMGPKSTTCFIEETILQKNYKKEIVVVNTTKTPNVPSGGSFETKTRFMFRWASETRCILKISFWLNWTGTSWIKGVIESSCKNAQISAIKDLVRIMEDFVDKTVEESEENVVTSEETEEVPAIALEPQITSTTTEPSLESSKIGVQQGLDALKNNKLILMLLMLILFYLFKLA